MRDFMQPALTGAVGAIANDALFTYLPVPAQLKAPGLPRYASKALSAVLMSWIASFVVNQRTATQLGVGALTCLTAEVARDFILTQLPAATPLAVEGMGLYTTMQGLGYYNPARPAGGGALSLYTPSNAASPGLPSLSTRETPGVGNYGANPDGFSYQ